MRYPHSNEEKFFNYGTPNVIILGEHDKGLGIPFSLTTTSGKRLRTMLSEIGGPYRLDNVFLYHNGKSMQRNLRALCCEYITIVVLGRIAEAECQRQGVRAIYLPHPAARNAIQVRTLRNGLRKILDNQRGPHA